MAKTPIMDFLKQATRAAGREVLAQSPENGAFTSRRDILLGGTAAAASLFIPAPLGAAEAKIAIVGAGLAGLTAAYRLKHRYGLNADVFEGNTRVGGRCFTARGIFANNQIAEHGGELIDTDQHSIRRLAGELGLRLTNVLKAQPPGTHEFYMFNGEPYNLSDATTDWMPVFHRVHHQNKKIGNPSYKGATDAAIHWDSLSISQWVAKTIPGGKKSKLGQLIENAFTEENALDADKQSAICAIQALALDKIDNFNLYYTASNQTFHIEGGNDQIATIIANDLGARLKTAVALIAIKQLADGRFRLTFASSHSKFDVTYDRVILTVPFSVMRVGVDFAHAGFSDLKVQSINTLLMGASCKTQLQFTERQWFKVGNNGEIRTPAVGFDTTWDVTRGQPGKSGIFNFFAGGTQAIQAGEMDDGELAILLMQEAEPLIPGLSALWNGLMIKNAWQFNPWSYGSYSTYQPGYQTTLLGIEKVPEGNCFFAGEHTEVQNGFLDAAVQSGDRAANEVAMSLGAPAALFSAAVN